jgi:hypothetical protein
MDNLTASAALRDLGLDSAQREQFFAGKYVVYPLATESDPGIAVIELSGSRLSSGIIEINDIGGGLVDFLRFRRLSRAVAVAVGATELELFGGAIINTDLEQLLIRQKFERSVRSIPEELGGDIMEVLTRVFPL